MIKIKQKFNKKIKIIFACIVLALISLAIFFVSKSPKNISLFEFENLRQYELKNVYLYDDMIYFSVNNKEYSILANNEIMQDILKTTSISKKSDFDYSMVFMLFMLIAFLYYLYYLRSFYKKPSNQTSEFVNNVLKPEYKFVLQSNIKFDDVIGQTKAKNELKKLSVIFSENKTPLIKGVLLTGASGVGKTMLAKALANACGVNFLYQSASSFNEIFVGLGAKRVRELFNNAKKAAPCIIFIDEIDALGKNRGSALANDSENTLNELLIQIDGFSELKNVLVIAATNRVDVLDNALLRRFDKKIYFTLPTYNDRLEFLKQLVSKDLISPNYNLDYLAYISREFNGANFKSLENELLTSKKLSQKDLIKEIFNIKYGISEILELNKDEQYIQAVYQAGKIVMAKICDMKLVYADLFNFEYFYENEHIKSSSQIKNEIKVLLSGVLSNEIFFGEKYNNFLKDSEKIQELLKLNKEFEIEILNNECKEYLKVYKNDIKNLANDLLNNKEIFF